VETINIAAARKNLNQIINTANQTHVPILITGNEFDAVLLSSEDWKAMEETMYLNSFPGLTDSIFESEVEQKENRLNADAVDW
jgi:antitoxin YefM